MASSVTVLASDEYWSRPDKIDEYVARKLANGSTSLFLGAGASHGFKLPNWQELVIALRTQCNAPLPVYPMRPEEEADMLLLKYFQKDRHRFAEAVRSALYASARQDHSFMLKSDLLQAVAAFLTNSIRGRGGAVVSFNFDDIVETYLRLLGFVVRSEIEVPAWSQKADVVVYHPHGILPLENKEPCSQIVFTTSDFDAVVGRQADAWNKTMESILSTTFPVFIGLSGEDSRLRALLNDVGPQHPARVKSSSMYWGVRPTPKSEPEHIVERWKGLGIAPRFIDSYDGLPSWLLGICQKAAEAPI